MRMETNKKTRPNGTTNRTSRKNETKVETPDNKKSSNKKRKFNDDDVNYQAVNKIKPSNKNLFFMSAVSNNFGTFLNTNLSMHSKFQKSVLINNLSEFEISGVSTPFERRVTSIAWHPKYPEISVAGSKGGDLLLHYLNTKHDKNIDDFFIPGVGAGGSVLGLKFCYDDPGIVYTASMTGKIYKTNLHKEESKVLLHPPFTWENWLTCLDICHDRNFLITGDCSGHSYLVKTSGEVVWKQKKLHSNKISFCEFNKKDPNIFVTSSVDKTVKLWDLRCLPDNNTRSKPLMQMNFDKGVSSACFSPSNGINLLVTDHHSQLRVYSSPAWNESLVISHPHRHFQHMTSIKAVWHPMADIIIVGRYPDDTLIPGDYRTIDFYDGSNGELLHQIRSPSGNIVSLNAVNCTGDTLLSSAGYHLVYLQHKDILDAKYRSRSKSESSEPKLDTSKKKEGPSTRSSRKVNSKNKKSA